MYETSDESFRELADRLAADQRETADVMTFEQRAAAGIELFDIAAEAIRAGIRLRYPTATEEEVERRLVEQLRAARKNDKS